MNDDLRVVDDRTAPENRSHETYETDRWETVHLESVDHLGVFESVPKPPATGSLRGFGDTETIRVDIDGSGHPGASAHDTGDNVQVSIWLTEERARQLFDELGDQLYTSGVSE